MDNIVLLFYTKLVNIGYLYGFLRRCNQSDTLLLSFIIGGFYAAYY